eukprot:scaffold7170_cov177-Skeletonema_marinoi.AAC.1
MVRTLLYGANLNATYWSAALLHAVYLVNRRVHAKTKATPYERWFGHRPNLQQLKTFGSRVCVKRTGHRQTKLDKHHFDGLFIGYSRSDENIRYIDLSSGRVKLCHHAYFDECWYLQDSRPPAAQLLYDLGVGFDQPEAPPPAQPRPGRSARWAINLSMDEKLGPNNIVDICLVRSEVILYIVKFVLIGIDVKA